MDLTAGRSKGAGITIAGDPLVEGEWYNAHLANTAVFADPISAYIAYLHSATGNFDGAPPELFEEIRTYMAMAEKRNNVKAKLIKYKGIVTGHALVAKPGIKAGDELFLCYGFTYSHAAEQYKKTNEKMQRLLILANTAIARRLSEKVALNEMD